MLNKYLLVIHAYFYLFLYRKFCFLHKIIYLCTNFQCGSVRL